jgi:hypothetical protein
MPDSALGGARELVNKHIAQHWNRQSTEGGVDSKCVRQEDMESVVLNQTRPKKRRGRPLKI